MRDDLVIVTLDDSNRGDWLTKTMNDPRLCCAQNDIQKRLDKQATFRSCGKEEQLDDVLIDKNSRRYCTAAEANHINHMGGDHRTVVAHVRLPCSTKSDSPDGKERKGGLRRRTRCTQRADTVESQESAEKNSPLEERYAQRETRLMKRQAAAASAKRGNEGR